MTKALTRSIKNCILSTHCICVFWELTLIISLNNSNRFRDTADLKFIWGGTRIADCANITGFWKHCNAFVVQGQVLDPDDKDTRVLRKVGNCQPTWRNIPEELNLHAVKTSHLASQVIPYCKLKILCTVHVSDRAHSTHISWATCGLQQGRGLLAETSEMTKRLLTPSLSKQR
jgi:hypothetical protein